MSEQNDTRNALDRLFGLHPSRGQHPDDPNYPAWICSDCGNVYGKYPDGHCATWHTDICGWCGETKPCTEPRDFSFPKSPAELGITKFRKVTE